MKTIKGYKFITSKMKCKTLLIATLINLFFQIVNFFVLSYKYPKISVIISFVSLAISFRAASAAAAADVAAVAAAAFADVAAFAAVAAVAAFAAVAAAAAAAVVAVAAFGRF